MVARGSGGKGVGAEHWRDKGWKKRLTFWVRRCFMMGAKNKPPAHERQLNNEEEVKHRMQNRKRYRSQRISFDIAPPDAPTDMMKDGDGNLIPYVTKYPLLKDKIMLTKGWQIFVEQYPQVMKAYRRMAKTDWFQNGNWVAFVGHYTNGIFMQVYKNHWYNHEFEGIHFEMALDERCVENKTASIQLHITHKNVLPDRVKFNQYTIPRMKALVSQWDSCYELSETKLSERLNLNVPFTQSNFGQKVADEIAQVCLLGAIIDEALAKLWG